MNNLVNYKKDRIIILSSHRPETLKYYDKVLNIEKGKSLILNNENLHYWNKYF